MKVCNLCEKSLDIDNFYWDISMKDGYQNRCKKCILKKQRQKRKEEKKEKVLEPPKQRKNYQRFFYGSKIPRPFNPEHAINIEHGVIRVVFD